MKKFFTENEQAKALRLSYEGKSVVDIAKELNGSYDSVCAFLRRQKVNANTIEGNGTRTITDIYKSAKGQKITPEIAMNMHELNPSEWDVVSFTSNSWESGSYTNTQYKIIVRPKLKNELTFEDIDNYFATKKLDNTPVINRYKPVKSDEVLEIDYADAHCGLLSWAEESGANYDLKIVKDRFANLVDDIFERAKNRKFSKIIFATLGDIIHIDNGNNTTTSGTPQTVDGRVPKIFNTAVDVMIDTIDRLLELNIPIEYIFVQGNHSRNLEYCLAKSLELAYRNNKNVTFNITPNPQKSVVIGDNLIGLCHGDIPRKNLANWLRRDYRKEYGMARFSEIHCGHLHEEAVKSDGGILVKTLPAICESSNWEHEQGYNAKRGVMCFVWDKKRGLRETWYNYI